MRLRRVMLWRVEIVGLLFCVGAATGANVVVVGKGWADELEARNGAVIGCGWAAESGTGVELESNVDEAIAPRSTRETSPKRGGMR